MGLGVPLQGLQPLALPDEPEEPLLAATHCLLVHTVTPAQQSLAWAQGYGVPEVATPLQAHTPALQ